MLGFWGLGGMVSAACCSSNHSWCINCLEYVTRQASKQTIIASAALHSVGLCPRVLLSLQVRAER
jgi:hypothetical protein